MGSTLRVSLCKSMSVERMVNWRSHQSSMSRNHVRYLRRALPPSPARWNWLPTMSSAHVTPGPVVTPQY